MPALAIASKLRGTFRERSLTIARALVAVLFVVLRCLDQPGAESAGWAAACEPSVTNV